MKSSKHEESNYHKQEATEIINRRKRHGKTIDIEIVRNFILRK